MLSTYPALFYKETDGSFSVVFPDLNHLATDGRDIQEAMQMAIDCLAGYIYSENKDGHVLPPPTPIDEIDLHCEDDENSEYETAFVNVISVDVEEYARKHFEKSVRKSLTIPKWLNDKAVARGINFSNVLRRALIAELS